MGWDQRGWGRTVKDKADRGLTGPTAKVLEDIAEVVESQLPCDVPLFLMGHSMGGGEVLTLASTAKYDSLLVNFRGIILESPFIWFATGKEPNFLVMFGSRIAGKLLPRMQQVNILPPEDLTRDPEVVKSLKEDPLCHNTGTLEGLSSLMERTTELHSGRLKLRKGIQALWLGHGTIDGGTNYAASKKWFEEQTAGISDKTFKSYEGWQHQLHADLPETRPIFAKDVGDWILARLGPATEQAKL